MKIISRGTAPEHKPIRFECVKCRTVFETWQLEATWIPDARDGDYWQHPCPVCVHICTQAVKSWSEQP